MCILCVFVCILCGLCGLCSVRRKFRIQAFYFAFRIRMMAIAAATLRILVCRMSYGMYVRTHVKDRDPFPLEHRHFEVIN